MRFLLRSAFFAGAVLALATPRTVRAQVIGFDDLTCGIGGGVSLGAYHGFAWNGFLCYNATVPAGGSPANEANAVTSLKNIIYNRGGSGSNIARATAFNFTSAWITRSVAALPETYRISGYLGASLVGFVDVAEPTTATLFTFNFTNVDKVVFDNISNPCCNAGLLMDDIMFDPVATGPVVPEPASIVLLGTGLAGLGLVARRRRAM